MSTPDEEYEPRWHWRNCRDFSLSFWVGWPMDLLRMEKEETWRGGWRAIGFGPFGVRIEYGTGQQENGPWLSDNEAWERACRYEGREP